MQRSKIKDILAGDSLNSEVLLKGWVRTKREQKSFSFIELYDGSCFSTLQIVADQGIDTYSAVSSINNGAAVAVIGKVIESQGKGQKFEIQATSLELVGSCDAETYPLQKKRHTNEYLRTIAHLRPRTNTFGAVFRVRSELSYAVHKFFKEKGFLYLHSPIITASDCEGAGEMFRVTTLDLENVPKTERGKVDFSNDFFAAETSLTVSGQLEGEIFACALSDIYTFGPTFRAENSNTARHLAEFWMIEPEMAFCDLAGDMDLAEEFTKYVVKYALENCAEDMEFFNKWIEKGVVDSLESLVSADFERVTYTKAIEVLEKSGKSFEYPVSWGIDLQTEHERYLTEEYFKKPVFVTNYPKEIKAFYMRLDKDERTVSAMDLLVPRCGELIGGSQREERGDVLERRMKECDLEPEPYWWYHDLRKYGTCPHAGFGLGFERLIMYVTGISNVRDVIPFPRTPGHAEF